MDTKRLTELDGLRGLAALAIVLFHYVYHYNTRYGHSFEVSEIFQKGYYGVHLFFIISGFVIYWTVSKSEKPVDFIWSRFSRLYPIFWVCLTITFIVVFIFSLPERQVNLNTYIANFAMFHEYLGYYHVDTVYWTLTLELAFYFWILTIFCFGQIKNIEKILIFWVIMASALTFYKFNIYIDPKLKKLFLLDYIELFSAGICFYRYKFKSHTFWTHLLLVANIVAIFARHPIEIAFGLLSFFLIFSLVINNRASILGNKILVYFGTISYSLYLIHQNIGYVIINKFYLYSFNPMLGIVTAIIFSLALSHLLMTYVERPSLKFLRGFYKHNNKIQRIGKKLTLLSNR